MGPSSKNALLLFHHLKSALMKTSVQQPEWAWEQILPQPSTQDGWHVDCSLVENSARTMQVDFPVLYPAAKNLPCNAGDAGTISGLGTKIPHDAEQLSPCATTRDLMHQQQMILHNTTKTLHATTKTWWSQINKFLEKNNVGTSFQAPTHKNYDNFCLKSQIWRVNN